MSMMQCNSGLWRNRRYWDWQLNSSRLDDADIQFQLQLRKRRLLQLLATWQGNLGTAFPYSNDVPPWGPALDEMQEVQQEMTRESMDGIYSESDKSGDEDNLEDDGLEPGLIEHLQTLELMDNALDDDIKGIPI
ncbi:hypothetical protein E1B28_006815 [Marasmius oreades]|uniref:Uncharacterized protein n=1 Tax=Marasmius oreades TaxID=181124 RepID=A0A9P7UWW7_9AGAR|nr:uncharacterized protein E1B28_006815 [Marasmius oreades]KAG7096142.1 hypothetical protein E1B28_006815 [Marasmius oreades]